MNTFWTIIISVVVSVLISVPLTIVIIQVGTRKYLGAINQALKPTNIGGKKKK